MAGVIGEVSWRTSCERGAIQVGKDGRSLDIMLTSQAFGAESAWLLPPASLRPAIAIAWQPGHCPLLTCNWPGAPLYHCVTADTARSRYKTSLPTLRFAEGGMSGSPVSLPRPKLPVQSRATKGTSCTPELPMGHPSEGSDPVILHFNRLTFPED